MEPFAPFINGVTKYAFTSREVDRDWAGTTVVHGPAEQFVADLMRGEGRTIGVHGSIALAQFLLRAGLIDELRLVVTPATIGTGRRLFESTELQRWDLASSESSPTGALLLHYRRTS